LVEQVARKNGKISRDLSINDYSDFKKVQSFAIELIDFCLSKAVNLKPEWLHYHKALLLDKLGKNNEAKDLLISFVQQKRSDYWTWHALAKVIESTEPKQSLSLCAKACLTCKDENFGVNVFEDLGRLASQNNELQVAQWSVKQAFNIRNQNGWKTPQSLRDMLNSEWYNHSGFLSKPEDRLFDLATEADNIIWSNCPKYQANYLGDFLNQTSKRILKFVMSVKSEAKEIISPERGMLKNLTLDIGEPVTITVDESSDRSTVVIVKRRESGNKFDILPTIQGRFSLKQGGFGFVDNVFVPPNLASQLEDGQLVKLSVVSRFDKRKNKQSLSAVTIQKNDYDI
ncbi:MAG: DUF7017 domain-containing protein, partial [Pseudanabaena sp.]